MEALVHRLLDAHVLLLIDVAVQLAQILVYHFFSKINFFK